MPRRIRGEGRIVQILWGLVGTVVVLLLAFALSTDRRAIRPRTVLGALAIQVLFAVVVLRWDLGKQALSAVANAVQRVIDSSKEGIDFLVGPILPAQGTVVAFQVLPIIVFVASLTAVLYHWNILQWVVRIIGGGLQKVLGTTRAESLNATANIFLGQTEAPLVVRPYLASMTRSEFFAVMVGGLSTVAGSVMVGYAMLGAKLENLIAASFMAAPAGMLMAKIIMPETEKPSTDSTEVAEATSETADAAADDEAEAKPRNVIDAAAAGASDGLRLALNVGAMLFAFVSLIALVNLIVGGLGGLFGLHGLTLQQILGYLFAPVMWVIGVPWHEAVAAGGFVGEKLVINEFVAFADFGPQIGRFSEKTATIITFALTGFANLGSLGILLGGLGGLVPSRRGWIARYGIRAVLAGTLANLLSATIAGVLV
ncbi:NupC/NupG family nucleoside CNT transporter [Saccharopolyspora rosea]|uniref:Nucleoside permease n=1 Tax=Saccharopolyspora rosea TaxID=524884 RepID=A0ABW3G0Z2_9PSEU|nr:NupC/NupG family nucleoside CNT transporter [Saccharopolyspora rosea]